MFAKKDFEEKDSKTQSVITLYNAEEMIAVCFIQMKKER